MNLEVIVPTDYYMEELHPEFEGCKLEDDLTVVRVEVDDVSLNCMSEEEYVEFVGIDSEFVVCTNWGDLM